MTLSTAGTTQSTEPKVTPIVARIRTALFDISAAEPALAPRRVLAIVCALFGVLLLWAIFAKLDIVAVAEGRLVPLTYVKIVQPADAGIIREILVEEGQSVEQGQALVRMDPTLNKADSTALQRELGMQQLQLRRIAAELAGKALGHEPSDDPLLFAQVQSQAVAHRQAFLDSVAEQKSARDRAAKELESAQEVEKKLATTLPSYERSALAFEKLAERQLAGSLQAEERRREAAEKAQDLQAQRSAVAALTSAIEQQEQRLAQLKSSYESELHQLRLQTLAEINRLEQQLQKTRYQQGLLELRAPQAGIVKDLATTTLGAVIQPGTVLLSLVPASEPLLAEVMIDNQDIGFVRPGQSVRIKLATYQFQKYGMLEGKVKTVSADSQSSATVRAAMNSDETATARGDQRLAFKAMVELGGQKLRTHDAALPLAAGMQVSAEIVEGRRTVLEYLLSPLQRVSSEAAMER